MVGCQVTSERFTVTGEDTLGDLGEHLLDQKWKAKLVMLDEHIVVLFKGRRAEGLRHKGKAGTIGNVEVFLTLVLFRFSHHIDSTTQEGLVETVEPFVHKFKFRVH